MSGTADARFVERHHGVASERMPLADSPRCGGEDSRAPGASRGPLRPAHVEFKRVYRCLQWNEPDRVLQVIMALMPKTKGPKPQLVIRADTWGYVIGALDEWIIQARIFYLVSGILEATLRARLNARLTDVYGPTWPATPGITPSKLHELSDRAARDAQLARVHDLLTSFDDGQPNIAEHQRLLADLREAIAPPPAPPAQSGAEFVRSLSFGGLRMFFEKKTLWTGQPQLQALFRGRDGTATPPQRDRLLAALRVLNDARNDIAHYRPLKYLSFDEPLFEAATLASWFGEDLQHSYSSIDTRHTTELSVLLTALPERERWTSQALGTGCEADGCNMPTPYEWLLARAPACRSAVSESEVQHVCLYHRVAIRTALHRPADR